MNDSVDEYFESGCGRCALGGTPDCKVHTWAAELAMLRDLLQSSELTAVARWGVPCYTYNQSNVLLLSAFKGFCSLSFFKGALLSDPAGLLRAPGQNSQANRQLQFTDVQQIIDQTPTIMAYIQEAIDVEKAGLKVTFKSVEEYEVPEEFEQRMTLQPELREAFEALTPGRQKGYLLHFAGAKKSQTRASRIDKCVDKILDGKGLHDR